MAQRDFSGRMEMFVIIGVLLIPTFLCLYFRFHISIVRRRREFHGSQGRKSEMMLVWYELINIQAYQYTDLLSCMLLDAYVL
jgi:hypothetical protein